MKKSLGTLLATIFACSASFGAEVDPASLMPADAAVYVTVRDVRPLVQVAASLVRAPDAPPAAAALVSLLDNLGQTLKGRVSVAFMAPKADADIYSFFAVAPIDQTKVKIDDAVVNTIRQLAGAQNIEFTTEAGIRHIRSLQGGAELFWAVKNDTLYIANVSAHVDSVVNPKPVPPVRPLSETTAYKGLGKHVDWTADVAAFADLEKLAWRRMRPAAPAAGPIRAENWTFPWLKPDQCSAVGLSMKGDGKTASVRFAVLTPPEPKGLVGFFDLPNAAMKNLNRIPENCQFVCAAAPLTPGLAKRFAKFMNELDPDVGKEFEDEMAEFSKELGVDIEKDLLDNFGSQTVAVRMPGAGDLAIYGAVEVADRAKFEKCADALAEYNKTPLNKTERNGRTYRLLNTTPRTGFTFDENLLLYSNAFEAVEAMFALKPRGTAAPPPGVSLADTETFTKLRARLPREAAFYFAADAHWLASTARTLLLLSADARKELAPFHVSRVLEALEASEPGLSIGLAVRNEPDAAVVCVESLACDPLALLAAIGKDLAEPTGKARNAAQKARSMNNLKNLAVAAMIIADADKDKTFPASLKAVAESGKIEDAATFLCPGSGTGLVEKQFVTDYDSALDRAGFPLSDNKVPVDLIMIWEKKPFFGDGRDAVRFDGHVEFLAEADFAAQLKKLDAWLAENRPK